MAADLDEKFMGLAIRLARKGSPSPNPYVGAILVKDNGIIGQGFHRKAGMAHAEVEALSSVADAEAKGATLYVNLEPCNHFGRTPPCTKAIIDAGVARVVFAMKDPNPDVKGGGEEELKRAGIEVLGGVLEKEARELNEIFVKHATAGQPFVILKAAMSMDGKIATRTGDSKWITGKKARAYAHRLRSRCDAVLVGVNTVLRDDPQLNARIRGGRNPVKIILDSGLRTPLEAKVLQQGKTLIAACAGCNEERKMALEAKGAEVLVLGQEDEARINLRLLLKELWKRGITSVLVEGGSEVHGSFLDEGLADKFVLFYAPLLVGGKEAKHAFGGNGVERIADTLRLTELKMRKLGQDFVFEAYPAVKGTNSAVK